MSASDPRYLSVPSARLADGIVCLPDGVERIVHRGETLWYLGMSPKKRPMMVVGRESGEQLLVHPLHCRTAEGETADQASATTA